MINIKHKYLRISLSSVETETGSIVLALAITREMSRMTEHDTVFIANLQENIVSEPRIKLYQGVDTSIS